MKLEIETVNNGYVLNRPAVWGPAQKLIFQDTKELLDQILRELGEALKYEVRRRGAKK